MRRERLPGTPAGPARPAAAAGHGRTPLRRVWLLGYRIAAHLVAVVLTRGAPGSAVYTRASFGRGVAARALRHRPRAHLPHRRGADRVPRALAALSPALTGAGLVDEPYIVARAQLASGAGRSVLDVRGRALRRRAGPQRPGRMLLHPGLGHGRASGSRCEGRIPAASPAARCPGAAHRDLARARLLVALGVPDVRRPA